MPRTAKIYIGLIICAGTAVLLFAAGTWTSANLPQFLILTGLAAVASALKVRIPGLESTLSPNFLFLLLAMLCCSFSELVVMTLVAALVQSLWWAKNPRLVQVAFSAAALILSASAAFASTRLFLGANASHAPLVFAIIAGTLYLPLNTALISAVIALVEGRQVLQVARTCYENVFPYFMGGIAFAGMVGGAFAQSAIWQGAAVLFPVVVLGYLYSLSRVPSSAGASSHKLSKAPVEDRELVEV